MNVHLFYKNIKEILVIGNNKFPDEAKLCIIELFLKIKKIKQIKNLREKYY